MRGVFFLILCFCGALFGADICVVMLVKDDAAAVIYRSLNSVKEIADYCCFCDVGASEGTTKIASLFMEEQTIDGKIYKQTWQDPRYNHTLALKTAQKMLEEKGVSLKSTYFLVLEPGVAVSIGSDFKKEALKEESYALLERAISLSCSRYNERLLQASKSWVCTGVFPLSWENQGTKRSEKLYSLILQEIEEANYIAQSTKQNVKWLLDALEKDPQHERYPLYLAQSYKSLKKYDEAIKRYQARIERGGNKEEVWFAKYMIGECFEEMDRFPDALHWYLEAFQYLPEWGDPLRKIATHYRSRGQNDIAYMFAKHGLKSARAHEQTLFPLNPLQGYQFDEELSIAAYYTNFKEDGYTASSDLTLRRNVPWYIKGQAYANILFYVENLKNARFEPIPVDLPFIHGSSSECYHPMNPSIHKTKDGYQVICRSVNYTQKGAKEFHTSDPSGVFRTRNFLVHFDAQCKKLWQQEIVENLSRERIRSFNLEGLDDCRLFGFQGDTYFTCTTNDTNPCGNFQISLCKLQQWGAQDSIEVESLLPLLGPDPYRCEKNWLPFVKDDQLHLIYLCDPFTVFQPNLRTGECKTALQYTPSYDFSHFRGSAAPIAFEDGYLMLVHEVTTRSDHSRVYLHRFVFLDQQFMIKKTSRPFIFLHQGVEFCCGMVINHSGSELILSVGIEDKEAYLCFVDIETVRSSLHPLPSLF